MKPIIALILCAAFCGRAQTNQPSIFKSQSRTVAAYRVLYSQLTNMSDQRLVLAIGAKHPELMQADLTLSNEFNFCSSNFPAMAIAQSVPDNSPITNITTLDGQNYSDVKIQKVDPDGIVISYGESGLSMTKLPFENLSDSLKTRFKYNADESADYKQRKIEMMAQLRANLTERDHLAVLSENLRADEGVQEYHRRQQEKLDKQLAESQQKAAEAQQKEADAAMLEALKPPPQINMQQNSFLY